MLKMVTMAEFAEMLGTEERLTNKLANNNLLMRSYNYGGESHIPLPDVENYKVKKVKGKIIVKYDWMRIYEEAED